MSKRQHFKRLREHLTSKFKSNTHDLGSFTVSYSSIRNASTGVVKGETYSKQKTLSYPTSILNFNQNHNSKCSVAITIIHSNAFKYNKVLIRNNDHDIRGFVDAEQFTEMLLTNKKSIYTEDLTGYFYLVDMIKEIMLDPYQFGNTVINDFWDKREDRLQHVTTLEKEVKVLFKQAQRHADDKYGDELKAATAELKKAQARLNNIQRKHTRLKTQHENSSDVHKKNNELTRNRKWLDNSCEWYNATVNFINKELEDDLND